MPRVGPTKYEPLERWLRQHAGPRVTLTFARVEEIIGAKLPPSGHRWEALWRGTTLGRPGGAIAAAGWRVERIDWPGETVHLLRDGRARPSATPAPAPLRDDHDPDAAFDPSSIVVERMDGGPRLVIDDAAALAYDFFRLDASSVGPNAYDAQIGKTDPDRITTADVTAINTTMRARSPHSAWESLTSAGSLPWLAAIPPQASLLGASDDEWRALRDAAEAAFVAGIGPHRNLSVATKVLHLKRPRFFPVLDSLVIEQLGGVGRPAIAILEHVRRVGRDNLEALAIIAGMLEKVHIRRSDVRILDVLLWSTHPAAGLAAKLGRWEHRIARRRADR